MNKDIQNNKKNIHCIFISVNTSFSLYPAKHKAVISSYYLRLSIRNVSNIISYARMHGHISGIHCCSRLCVGVCLFSYLLPSLHGLKTHKGRWIRISQSPSACDGPASCTWSDTQLDMWIQRDVRQQTAKLGCSMSIFLTQKLTNMFNVTPPLKPAMWRSMSCLP